MLGVYRASQIVNQLLSKKVFEARKGWALYSVSILAARCLTGTFRTSAGSYADWILTYSSYWILNHWSLQSSIRNKYIAPRSISCNAISHGWVQGCDVGGQCRHRSRANPNYSFRLFPSTMSNTTKPVSSEDIVGQKVLTLFFAYIRYATFFALGESPSFIGLSVLVSIICWISTSF